MWGREQMGLQRILQFSCTAALYKYVAVVNIAAIVQVDKIWLKNIHSAFAAVHKDAPW